LTPSIDGKPVKNAAAYRAESPLFRYGPLTAGNVLNVPPGTQSDSVAAGYFLLLPPFSAGVHRIVVRAKIPAAQLVVDAEFVVQGTLLINRTTTMAQRASLRVQPRLRSYTNR
jgi:hypothetical protein